MYGVLHGGTDRQLRAESAAFLSRLPFDGYAVGGSLGRDHEQMIDLLEYVVPLLADSRRPRHLLGIGDERGVRAAAELGFDTMDSCYPTRIARHGTLLTRAGKLHISSGKFARDYGPIDPEIPTVSASRAYMHHLAKMNEPLFTTLAALHNLYYMTALMQELRERIRRDEI
jgi:queuine tRNA-ribosyltransferase